MDGFCINLLTSLIAGTIIFLVGIFWPKIPKSIRKYKLRQFWGKGVLGNDFLIVYGALRDSRIREENKNEFWYDKYFHDGKILNIRGPRSYIVSDCEIRSASYIINTLSNYREEAVTVRGDFTSFSFLNKTIISLGSPSSNELSSFILNEEGNRYFRFSQEKDKSFIQVIENDSKFQGFQLPIRKDYGIIIKIPNSRFPGKFLFVCAGLGEWGTSGASWYLANKWNDLRKEFGESFGIIVEVDIGSDESTVRVYP